MPTAIPSSIGSYPELALLWCVLLNLAVLAAAFRFASHRLHPGDRWGAILDAGVLWYGVQYVSIGLPGMAGCLTPTTIAAVALLVSVLLWFGGGEDRQRPVETPAERLWTSWLCLAVGTFAAGEALAYAHFSRGMPVTTNDALTYHFPAAVQWLQRRSLGLFQTWFFNPANTYSPLAGSTFIAWLIAPLGNDALARFVELPPLLLIGLAVGRMVQRLGGDALVATLVGAATIMSRPFLHQAVMGLDDLFVTLFFLCAVLVLTDSAGPLLWLRLGLSLGLMLATKYTALLSVPILLLAADAPWRSRWPRSAVPAAVAIAAAVAGPWLVRNACLSGNPLFPVSFAVGSRHLGPGLFTVARSQGLRTAAGIWACLTARFAMSPELLTALPVMAVGLLVLRFRQIRRDPLLRLCSIGPFVGVALFLWRAPFPEARFVFPSFALLMAAGGGFPACLPALAAQILGAVLLAVAASTVFPAENLNDTLSFLMQAACVTALVLLLEWLRRRLPVSAQITYLAIPLLLLGLGFTYVFWLGTMVAYERAWQSDVVAWALIYPPEQRMWAFVNANVPADATLAYTNMYLVYPLQGFGLQRRLVYAPSRPGVKSVGQLGWLGDDLSGEQIVPAAARAATADADQSTWLANLAASGADYLVIGKGGVIGVPPEAGFAAAAPATFHRMFEDDRDAIYQINRSLIAPARPDLPASRGGG